MERYGGYTWRQDHDNVIVQIPIPAKMSSKADLDLVITNTTIKAGVKGQPPQLEGETWEKLDKDSCNWTIEPQLLTLHLEKMAPTNQPWPDLIIKAPRNAKDALDKDAQIDPKSQFELRKLTRDASRQWALCIASADRGYVFAQMVVAQILLNGSSPEQKAEGFDVQPDTSRGISYLRRAADAGDENACLELALCLHYGKHGEPVDVAAAVLVYEKIVSVSESAAYQLGTIYEEGAKGIKREPIKAVGCYMKAPKNPKAQWRLGMLLVRGEGVESNPSMGAALIQQAAAADPALKLKDSEASYVAGRVKAFEASLQRGKAAAARGVAPSQTPEHQSDVWTYLGTAVLVAVIGIFVYTRLRD